MFNAKLKGFDEAISNLNKFSEKVKKGSGKQNISLSVLLNASFMKENTKFNNAEDFFEKGGFSFKNAAEFKAIDKTKLDQWIKDNSNFKSWGEMLKTAGAEYVKKQIGF